MGRNIRSPGVLLEEIRWVPWGKNSSQVGGKSHKYLCKAIGLKAGVFLGWAHFFLRENCTMGVPVAPTRGGALFCHVWPTQLEGLLVKINTVSIQSLFVQKRMHFFRKRRPASTATHTIQAA